MRSAGSPDGTTFYPTDAQRTRLVTAYTKHKDTAVLEVTPPRPDCAVG